MDLTERKKRILRAIIESYIQSAEPVGSKAIAASIDMEVSSATIRNEMADLEAMGLLEKPHTSAGRIPSPKGYRLYVNELMDEYKLSMQETDRINAALHMRMKALDKVIDEAGRVVAKLTQYPAFALTAAPERVTIGHCSDSNDMAYLHEVLATGCYIGMDRLAYYATRNSLENIAKNIAKLIEDGYQDRILLGHDWGTYFGWWEDWETFREDFVYQRNPKVSQESYALINKTFVPILEAAGVEKLVINEMLRENPKRFFA